LRWQIRNPPRPYSCPCVATILPSRAGDSVWPVSPSVPVSAVTSASAVALRHRSLAKRNGAHRRTEEGEKTGGGENSAVAGSVPIAARLSPLFLMKRCTIPFGRKWVCGKRKCGQQPARQVLACNGRNAKRNLLLARARSVFEANRVPAVGRVPLLPTLASRRFRLARKSLLLPSAQCSPSVPFFSVTAVWPNGMVHSLFVIVCTYGLLTLSLMFGFSGHPVNR